MGLRELREELDRLDQEIVRLYTERLSVCGAVARDKLRTGKAVLDPERERQKLSAVEALAESDFEKKAVREFYRQLMTVSRRLQLGILQEAGRGTELPFRELPELPKRQKTVAYQGIEGAYAYLAAREAFGADAAFRAAESWREGMELVRSGEADYMVLPIENSSHGAVYDNLDLLLEYPELVIQEEIDLPVEHALIAAEGAVLSGIRRVYSHPQALGQCRSFFRAHSEITAVPAENTALAAKLVAESGDLSAAALASETAAALYGLRILQRRVNQERSNTTRFLVLGAEHVYRRGAGKVSIFFETGHHPGALYNILGNFLFNDVNMRMIQSRPIPDKPFEYRFFADIEGKLSEDKVRNALNGIAQETAAFRILGCY